VEDLYEFLSGYTLPRDPGSEFEYSNLGAGLLGHLLASRIGTDYESAIRIRITEPLGMPDTAIALSSSMKQRMATGHNAMLAPVAYWDLPTLAGAGALRSSANDMLTFLEAFLGYRESPLAPAMKAMLDVRRPMGKMEIGLAWFLIGRAPGMEEPPAVSARFSDASRKRGLGSLSCPMRRLQSVSMTSAVIS
jgi:CubicO group peptidase (beta-lactamase class C family)